MFLDHRRVRHIRGRLAGAKDEAGVLQREKALGDGHVAHDRQRQGHCEHAQRHALVGEGTVQAPLVPVDQAFAETALVPARWAVHEQRTQGRRQGQRHHH